MNESERPPRRTVPRETEPNLGYTFGASLCAYIRERVQRSTGMGHSMST